MSYLISEDFENIYNTVEIYPISGKHLIKQLV